MLLLGPAISAEAIGVACAAAGLLGLAMAGAGRRIGWPLYAAAQRSFWRLPARAPAFSFSGRRYSRRLGGPATAPQFAWYLAIGAASAARLPHCGVLA